MKKKESYRDNYDPHEIWGYKIADSFFEAVNMAIPSAIDPDVAELYRIYFAWDRIKHKYSDGIDQSGKLGQAAVRLVEKYNS